LGFGTWGLGGNVGPLSGYGPTDDEESKEALERAVNLGITFFDTAPPYGKGKSEKLIGEVLKNKRNKCQILTKVGINAWGDEPNYSPPNTLQSIKNSLIRLNTNYLDYVIFHSIKEFNLEDIVDDFLYLENLKNMNLIKKIGFSLKNPSDIIKLEKIITSIDVLEVNYNILDTRLHDKQLFNILDLNKKIEIIARTPFAFGFCTDKITESTVFHPSDHRARWSREQILSWLNARNEIKTIFNKYGYVSDLRSLSLQFCLSTDIINYVIPGMMTVNEVDQNFKCIDLDNINSDCINEIIEFNTRNQIFLK